MKKYLICGAMALAAGLFITSCTHDDIGYDNLYDEKTQTFDKVFKDLYGTIDPNHDWGFTPYVDITDASTTSSARALTRISYPNGNMWADEWVVPTALTTAQKDKVRRWFQTHKDPQGTSFSHTNFFVQQVYKGGTNTTGSESPEVYAPVEGKTFKGSDRMDHLTCGTWGEGATTENNDGRNFYDHVNNFNNGNCTAWEGLMLMLNSKSNAFGYYNSNGSVGHNLFVIISGDDIQKDLPDGGDDANVSGMFFVGLDFEQLIGDNVYTSDYYTGPDGNKYRYLNSKKNQYCGDLKKIDPEPTGNDAQKLLDDGYRPVQNTADKDWVKLAKCADGYYSDWIVRVIPGTKKSTNNNQQTEKEETSNKDKYKAKRHVILAKGRVFVEDLYNATRADIDFNDAVFDAIIWKDQNIIVDRTKAAEDTLEEDGNPTYRLEIALLAAGGTIPLTIGQSTKGVKFGDVHNRFGVGLTTIVNTVGEASNVFGSSVTGKKCVCDTIDITDVIDEWKGNKPITLNIIPIDVEWTSSDNTPVAARLNNKDTHTYKTDDEGKLIVGDDGELEVLSSEAPVVPHILQAPIGTAWPQERVNIGLKDEGAYRDFPNYVKNYKDYKDKVWESGVDPFYLYGDNPTPLAYSNNTKYPVGYDYLTDIVVETSYEGKPLWNGPDKGQFVVTIAASELTNASSTSKIRIYVTSSPSSGYWHIALKKKDWSDLNIPEWNNKNLIYYNPQPSDFPGYVEFNLSNGVKSSITDDGGFIIQTTNNNDPFSVDCITFIQ